MQRVQKEEREREKERKKERERERPISSMWRGRNETDLFKKETVPKAVQAPHGARIASPNLEHTHTHTHTHTNTHRERGEVRNKMNGFGIIFSLCIEHVSDVCVGVVSRSDGEGSEGWNTLQ